LLGRSARGIVADAFKTQRRANGTVLRSKTPDRVQQVVQQVVQQERWGLLLAPFVVRQRMTQAAWARRLDPDRLAFTHAVRVIKRKMPQAAAIPPERLTARATRCSRRSRSRVQEQLRHPPSRRTPAPGPSADVSARI